jgi:hypothetical protein
MEHVSSAGVDFTALPANLGNKNESSKFSSTFLQMYGKFCRKNLGKQKVR